MWFDAFFIVFWLTFISGGAILVVRHEFNQDRRETKDRIAEITRGLKRRGTPAE